MDNEIILQDYDLVRYCSTPLYSKDEVIKLLDLARADERDNKWTPITGEASLPKDDEALCVLARYTSKGDLRTTPVEKVGFFKGMFPLNEFQFYTILQPPVK